MPPSRSTLARSARTPPTFGRASTTSTAPAGRRTTRPPRGSRRRSRKGSAPSRGASPGSSLTAPRTCASPAAPAAPATSWRIGSAASSSGTCGSGTPISTACAPSCRRPPCTTPRSAPPSPSSIPRRAGGSDSGRNGTITTTTAAGTRSSSGTAPSTCGATGTSSSGRPRRRPGRKTCASSAAPLPVWRTSSAVRALRQRQSGRCSNKSSRSAGSCLPCSRSGVGLFAFLVWLCAVQQQQSPRLLGMTCHVQSSPIPVVVLAPRRLHLLQQAPPDPLRDRHLATRAHLRRPHPRHHRVVRPRGPHSPRHGRHQRPREGIPGARHRDGRDVLRGEVLEPHPLAAREGEAARAAAVVVVPARGVALREQDAARAEGQHDVREEEHEGGELGEQGCVVAQDVDLGEDLGHAVLRGGTGEDVLAVGDEAGLDGGAVDGVELVAVRCDHGDEVGNVRQVRRRARVRRQRLDDSHRLGARRRLENNCQMSAR
ncbi:hypothetical protein DFJ74DRAFT_260330 [Hyaloraphidium curvatum]|nr:hypothetical protein DFJ74DRAFT_260330 [Hyaloraphidium curvatum]